jgi:hypothetical protein
MKVTLNNNEIEKLLSDEDEHLDKLHQIVKDSLNSEKLIIQKPAGRKRQNGKRKV